MGFADFVSGMWLPPFTTATGKPSACRNLWWLQRPVHCLELR